MFKSGNVVDWLKVAVLLLDEAAAAALVFAVLHFFDIQIQLPVVIALALVLGAIVFVTHKAVIPSFHRKIVTGSEGMIGAQGKAVGPLSPEGTVSIRGEYWKAKSIDKHIKAGEEVEVVGKEGLTLKVKRKE